MDDKAMVGSSNLESCQWNYCLYIADFNRRVFPIDLHGSNTPGLFAAFLQKAAVNKAMCMDYEDWQADNLSWAV